jgi:PBSX family phage terminase large subunit
MATGFKWGRFSRKGLESIANSDARFNLWHGAVRSSKTVCSIFRWLSYVETAPDGDLAMIAKTERTLARNIIGPMSQMVEPGEMVYNRGLGLISLFGRTIYTIGANDERAVEKIQGWTLAGAYGDEVVLWPESAFRMMGTRLSVPGSMFFGTMNPDSPLHYLKTNYIDRAGDLDLKAFHFELADNLNLDPRYVANLKKEYTGLWYKRFIEGLWVLAEGAIYDMWDDDKNLFNDATMPVGLKLHGQRYIGVDYGTTNPMAWGDWWDDGTNLWMTKEYYYDSRNRGGQKTDSQYADDFDAFVEGDRRPVAVIIDPSAASFRAELVSRGYVVKAAINEVLDGIRMTSTAIGRRIIRVHERCEHTRQELAGYVWDDKARIHGVEQPVKVNDHGCDQTRYIVRTILPSWRLAA